MSKLEKILYEFDWNMIMSDDNREWSKAIQTAGLISVMVRGMGREGALQYLAPYLAQYDERVRAEYKFFGYDGNEIVEKYNII